MADHLDEINKIIQKAALDGVLTTGAVTQFHQVLEENKVLKEQAIDLDRKFRDASEKNTKLTSQLSQADHQLKVASERESNLLEREKKITELELTAKYQGQRVDDHKSMVSLIFRNSVLRKEVMTPVEGMAPGNGMSGTSGYANKDQVTETEE